MRIEYLKNNVIFLKLMTMYKSDENWNWLQRILYYMWRCVWLYSIVSTVFYLSLDLTLNGKKDITNLTVSLMHLALFSSISLRGILFLCNLDNADNLMKEIREEFKPSTRFALEPDTMEGAHMFCDKFFKVWVTFVIVAGLLLAGGILFKPDREMALPLWTFYDWRETPYYQITVALQTISQLNMVISFSNLDMLSVCFMKLASKQFDILATDFGNTIENALRVCGCPETLIRNISADRDVEALDAIVCSTKFQEKLKENFNSCIEHHKKILDVVKHYQQFMSPHLLIEVYFLFCYMIFALYLFIATNDTSLYPALSQYLIGSMLQIYLLCNFGQILTTSVENMRITLYTIRWYIVHNKSFLMNFHIVLMRMNRPVKITAGKILPLALDSFLEFMKKAFSFYTVLKQMQ